MAAFKDIFNPTSIREIGAEIERIYPRFPNDRFISLATDGLKQLEMKDRSLQIARALQECLPGDFGKASRILVKSLGPVAVADAASSDEEAEAKAQKRRGPRASGLRGFLVWPLTQYVQIHGLEAPEHFDVAMSALYEMTRRFTAEFAIRPFLAREPERTLAVLREWASDECEHVRRLVSEGTRPLLPWGERLPAFRKDPRKTLELLEGLRFDPSEYVRRSVANHLNDVAKDHPAVVTKLLKRWLKDAKQSQSSEVLKQTLRLARHACRTLIKKGDSQALALFGFSSDPKVKISELKLSSRKVKLGDALEFSFTLHCAVKVELESATTSASKSKSESRSKSNSKSKFDFSTDSAHDLKSLQAPSQSAQKLVVDYAIHHLKANGRHTAKVFKLANKSLPAGGHMPIAARHSFKMITTRRYYPGPHYIEILVNGISMGQTKFIVTEI